MQELQRETDRLAADAFSQVEHDGDEKRQCDDLVQFLFKRSDDEGGEDTRDEVAAKPGESAAKCGPRRVLQPIGRANADQLKQFVALFHLVERIEFTRV